VQVLYKHTQVAWHIILPADIAALVCLYLVFARGITLAAIGFFVLVLMTYLFYALTVTGTEETLQVKFGIGLIRKSFRLRDIYSVEPFRTSFWHGWGIHYSPDGTVFNVSGFGAVRLTMTGGKRYIIGTDDGDRLRRYIEANRQAPPLSQSN
jgi:hypothetical protein